MSKFLVPLHKRVYASVVGEADSYEELYAKEGTTWLSPVKKLLP